MPDKATPIKAAATELSPDWRPVVRQIVREELAAMLGQLAAQLQTQAGSGVSPAPGIGAARPRAGIDPRTLAILTAAAVAAVGGPVRVRRVTFVNHNTISAWAETGRLTIQSSHNFRKSP